MPLFWGRNTGRTCVEKGVKIHQNSSRIKQTSRYDSIACMFFAHVYFFYVDFNVSLKNGLLNFSESSPY